MNRETLREAIARRIDLVENVGPAHIEHDPESWRQCLPAAEAALAAIEAAGVRLVPSEATEEMQVAGMNDFSGHMNGADVRCLHTAGVAGSNPASPTSLFKALGWFSCHPGTD